jgi:hypothetical protein
MENGLPLNVIARKNNAVSVPYLYGTYVLLKNSFTEDKCCGSGMFIPDPGSRIPDPKTATTEKGEKN